METTKKPVKRVWSIILNVIIWLFVIFAVVMTVLAFAAQSSPDGVPSIFGQCILTVQSGSMEPEFAAGDIIIGRKLEPEELNTLQVGDVISFDAGDLDGDGRRDINSHRIIEINKEGNTVTYVVKGDNDPKIDNVLSSYVVCKYEGTRIAGLGKALNFLQTPNGFLIVIVLPLVLFFLYELIVFVRKLSQVKNEGKKQITAADEELIRQRAVEEYLRQQQAQQADAADQSAQDVPPTPAAVEPVSQPVAQESEETNAAEDVTAVAEEAPEVAEEAPEVAEEAPEVAEEAPEVAEETPEVAEKTPEVAEETPEVAEEVTEVAEEAPEVAEETAEVAEEESSNALS
jgi:signal peptidase